MVQLVARKVLPLFNKGDIVLLDAGVDPVDHPELAGDDIQQGVEYEVVTKTIRFEEYTIRLKCPDGRSTDPLPAKFFIPKLK
jgi:hypothetical protein